MDHGNPQSAAILNGTARGATNVTDGAQNTVETRNG